MLAKSKVKLTESNLVRIFINLIYFPMQKYNNIIFPHFLFQFYPLHLVLIVTPVVADLDWMRWRPCTSRMGMQKAGGPLFSWWWDTYTRTRMLLLRTSSLSHVGNSITSHRFRQAWKSNLLVALCLQIF